jgi:hypothetical protein
VGIRCQAWWFELRQQGEVDAKSLFKEAWVGKGKRGLPGVDDF